jgi:hypothetical protein
VVVVVVVPPVPPVPPVDCVLEVVVTPPLPVVEPLDTLWEVVDPPVPVLPVLLLQACTTATAGTKERRRRTRGFTVTHRNRVMCRFCGIVLDRRDPGMRFRRPAS